MEQQLKRVYHDGICFCFWSFFSFLFFLYLVPRFMAYIRSFWQLSENRKKQDSEAVFLSLQFTKHQRHGARIQKYPMVGPRRVCFFRAWLLFSTRCLLVFSSFFFFFWFFLELLFFGLTRLLGDTTYVLFLVDVDLDTNLRWNGYFKSTFPSPGFCGFCLLEFEFFFCDGHYTRRA
ncbi:hypothetical protein B0H65DRAFT_5263 [Neurospora tetraspora]|uniref:Transmembrane protein n=1 Tax=Neurospora tetraspora TaxID=94610 RepID=A0AAE0JMA9_9PEZI|nr:hypothetical protein B0H65DRAFT_5263 [Neurospora tetraspora]